MNASTSDLSKMLPATVDGWSLSGEYFYQPGDLYDYINGGAELYLSYGFMKMMNRVYTREGQPDIVVDLFDMSRGENAFGVFSHSRESLDSTFGQGSQYTSGLLSFWKDRYYISILASPETPESKSAVEKMARAIEKSIPSTGQLPALLDFLPGENLKTESIRYFTHHIWLNSYFFIADENIFQIGEDAPAVLARYPGQGTLLLIRYPGPARAQQAFQAFEKYFAAQSIVPGTVREVPVSHQAGEAPEVRFLTGLKIVQLEDGSWAGARLYDRQFTAVFQGESEAGVSILLAEVSGTVAQ